jgi:hypothetical protein
MDIATVRGETEARFDSSDNIEAPAKDLATQHDPSA